MSSGRKILIVVCLVGIFVAGGATGTFGTLRYMEHVAGKRGLLNSFVIRQRDKIARELDLTPEQKEKVDRILSDGGGKISEIRQQSIRESAVCFRDMNQKISAVLNPEQKVKFEEFLKKQRERIRRFQQERGDRRGPPPDEAPEGPPPPPSSNP